MFGKRKAEDISEESGNKQSKTDKKERTEDINVKEEENGEKESPVSSANNDNENGSQDGFASAGTCDRKDDRDVVASHQPLTAFVVDIMGIERVKGPDDCGMFLICGGTNWDLTGRKNVPKGTKGATGRNLWSPHRFTPLNGVRVRLVASGSNSVHSIIVTEEGRAMSLGRNEKGQLGVGDTKRRDLPTVIEALKDHNVVGAACGKNHTLILTDRGVVYGCGDNKFGQCGVGNQNPAILTATAICYKGPPIVKLGCGAEFSMILDCKGALHSFGLPEYGQLGHNTDGKYFVTCNKLGFHCETAPKRIVFYIEKAKDGHITPVEVVEIIDFSCGSNHTVAVDSLKRVFSWGWGGLGRLGHAEQKDEMIPRLIKFFDTQSRGVKSVHCGSSFSLAINELGAVYLFGQTKRTGEANMYPKPIQDLTGWSVRSVGCGFTSIVMAADDSVIAWGPSPTYGELGFGELHKSSTTPMEVKALEGIYILQVSCGLGHTLLIARDQSEQDRAKLMKLPEFTP